MTTLTPSSSAPLVDADSKPTSAWFRFFSSLTAPASAGSVVSLSASPMTYTAPDNGTVFISGGTVSSVKINRGRLTILTGVTSGPFPVSQGDALIVTYTGTPSITFLPR